MLANEASINSINGFQNSTLEIGSLYIRIYSSELFSIHDLKIRLSSLGALLFKNQSSFSRLLGICIIGKLYYISYILIIFLISLLILLKSRKYRYEYSENHDTQSTEIDDPTQNTNIDSLYTVSDNEDDQFIFSDRNRPIQPTRVEEIDKYFDETRVDREVSFILYYYIILTLNIDETSRILEPPI